MVCNKSRGTDAEKGDKDTDQPKTLKKVETSDTGETYFTLVKLTFFALNFVMELKAENLVLM